MLDLKLTLRNERGIGTAESQVRHVVVLGVVHVDRLSEFVLVLPALLLGGFRFRDDAR